MPAKTAKPSEDLNNPYGYSDMDWAAQLDPAYAAARAEVRRLSVGEDFLHFDGQRAVRRPCRSPTPQCGRGRHAVRQSEGTDRAGGLGVAGPPVWRGRP